MIQEQTFRLLKLESNLNYTWELEKTYDEQKEEMEYLLKVYEATG
jgi:hypothetical protein